MVRKLMGAIALGALAVAACSGASEDTTTTAAAVTTTATTAAGSVVFGSGSLPETVPDDFPIPGGAVIGTTLVDTVNERTEVIIVLPADPEAVVLYFEEALPEAGYEVRESGPEGASHRIGFTGEGITGEILVGVGSLSTATAFITLAATG